MLQWIIHTANSSSVVWTVSLRTEGVTRRYDVSCRVDGLPVYWLYWGCDMALWRHLSREQPVSLQTTGVMSRCDVIYRVVGRFAILLRIVYVFRCFRIDCANAL